MSSDPAVGGVDVSGLVFLPGLDALQRCPDGTVEPLARAQKARTDLWVRTSPADTDTAWLDAHLPAEDAAAIRTALDAAATTMAARDGETRSKDQLRAAALAAPSWTALATGTLTTPDGALPLTSAHGQAPALEVTAAASPQDVPQLRDHGPITPDLGRDLACRTRTGPRPVVRVIDPVDSAQATCIAEQWPEEPLH